MTIRISILAIALVALSSGAALAQTWDAPKGDPNETMREQGPDIERLASRLGLDADTKDKIKAIKRQARHDLMDARFAVKKEKLTLRELLEEEDPSESQIMRQIEEIGRLEVEVRKVKVRSLLAVRAMLTPEQREEAKKLRRSHKEKRRGDRKHRKMKQRF